MKKLSELQEAIKDFNICDKGKLEKFLIEVGVAEDDIVKKIPLMDKFDNQLFKGDYFVMTELNGDDPSWTDGLCKIKDITGESVLFTHVHAKESGHWRTTNEFISQKPLKLDVNDIKKL